MYIHNMMLDKKKKFQGILLGRLCRKAERREKSGQKMKVLESRRAQCRGRLIFF